MPEKFFINVPSPVKEIPTWRDVYDVINGGAFAVLVTGALFGAWLWKVGSKPLKEYLEAQSAMNRKLQETITSNSDTLKSVSVTLEKINDRQETVEDTLAAMQAGVPAMANRQKLQVRYLKAIASEIKLPMPVHITDDDDDDE